MTGDPIVVGTDGSSRAELAVDRAGEIAEALGVPVHVVCVPSALRTRDPSPVSAARQVVGEASERLRSRGVTVETHVPEGDGAQALVALAEQEHAQMIVVGNRGMIGIRRALGSLPDSVTHRARGNVLLVRTKGRSLTEFVGSSVVVGTNGTDDAMQAVREAIRLAKAVGGELHVVSIFKPPTSPEDAVAAAVAEAAAQGVEAVPHVRTDEPVWALHRVAKKHAAGIIVISDAGMHEDDRVRLGNIPDTLSHRGTASVLIVAAGRPERSGRDGTVAVPGEPAEA